jgi:hypothetical protein
MITTQKTVRTEFWNSHPHFERVSGWTQNKYDTDIRMAFCDFVESLSRSEQINQDLAFRVTL